jgi:hypothetical protein
VTTPIDWVRGHTPSVHMPHLPSGWGGGGHEEEAHPPSSLGARLAGRTKTAWHDATAGTLAAMMSARDTAAAAYDGALKRAGLREEERSRLQRARDNMDIATARVWTLLGYGPTYTPSEQRRAWDGRRGRVDGGVASALRARTAYPPDVHPPSCPRVLSQRAAPAARGSR